MMTRKEFYQEMLSKSVQCTVGAAASKKGNEELGESPLNRD